MHFSFYICKAGTTENNKGQELIPDCCACGTAKYQMTFHGLWSRQTHPNQFPTRMYPLPHIPYYPIMSALPIKEEKLWNWSILGNIVKELCRQKSTKVSLPPISGTRPCCKYMVIIPPPRTNSYYCRHPFSFFYKTICGQYQLALVF